MLEGKVLGQTWLMSSVVHPPLIIGAGPTGLAAALFLHERGVTARVIDQADQSSAQSKALGVNPRTLELLEASGVTDRMLAAGRKMTMFNIWRPGKKLATVNLGKVKHRYPFMLILSQAESERLLTEALSERGITVERGLGLTNLIDNDRWVTATLSTGETVDAPYALGADGAHSTVRKVTGRSFEGSTWPEPWHLYDVRLETALPPDEGHAFLLNKGVLLLIRIKVDLWRVVSNVPHGLEQLPSCTSVTDTVWESEFGFAHRIADPLCAFHMCLAGDAAHIHSAFGARGMNLGIEDAYVFAALAVHYRLKDYDALRRPVIKSVVKNVMKMTQVPRGNTVTARLVRHLTPLIPFAVGLGERSLRRWLLGLDHEVKIE